MLLVSLLTEAVCRGASDIHLAPGAPPALRINGQIVHMRGWYWDAEQLRRFWEETAAPHQQKTLKMRGDCDLSCEIAGVGRFRVHVFRRQGTLAMAIRVIPPRIPLLDDLGAPPAVEELTRCSHGLVVVTGPAGSGKTTTLAAMLAHINRERAVHIITLEDPIEFCHANHRGIVTQREIGRDAPDFSTGLRAALREDPDVIFVGEMRDADTLMTALAAAETGHLVLTTLHTATAGEAVERIIYTVPHREQPVRMQLAATLRGVVVQQLVPHREEPRRIAAFAVLVGTPAVASVIREGKTHQLSSLQETGAAFGMRTMDQAIQDLGRAGLIAAGSLTGRR